MSLIQGLEFFLDAGPVGREEPREVQAVLHAIGVFGRETGVTRVGGLERGSLYCLRDPDGHAHSDPG